MSDELPIVHFDILDRSALVDLIADEWATWEDLPLGKILAAAFAVAFAEGIVAIPPAASAVVESENGDVVEMVVALDVGGESIRHDDQIHPADLLGDAEEAETVTPELVAVALQNLFHAMNRLTQFDPLPSDEPPASQQEPPGRLRVRNREVLALDALHYLRAGRLVRRMSFDELLRDDGSFEEALRQSLRGRSGIYMLLFDPRGATVFSDKANWFANRVVIYVGKATDLLTRLGQHRRKFVDLVGPGRAIASACGIDYESSQIELVTAEVADADEDIVENAVIKAVAPIADRDGFGSQYSEDRTWTLLGSVRSTDEFRERLAMLSRAPDPPFLLLPELRREIVQDDFELADVLIPARLRMPTTGSYGPPPD